MTDTDVAPAPLKTFGVVAVGVNADAKVVRNRFVHGIVVLLLGHGQDPKSFGRPA